MAIVTNTYQTTAAVGNREALSDIIYNISPQETPFMSMAGRMKAKATYEEWQTDALDAATSNAQIEGDETTFQQVTPTVRVGNRTQISKKSVVISGTQEIVDKAGRDSEMSYQMAKKMSELKRDMEKTVTGNQASSAGGSGTARTLGSVEAWLTTNVSRGTTSASGGFTAGNVLAASDGTVRANSEGLLKTVMQSVWTNGGKADTIIVGPYNKRIISAGYTGIATQYRENSGVKQATILGAASVYVSDFGELKIVPSRFSRDRSMLVLDMDYWALSYLRPFKTESLAKTGDAEKKQIIVEYTLISKQEAASGVVADLSTS